MDQISYVIIDTVITNESDNGIDLKPTKFRCPWIEDHSSHVILKTYRRSPDLNGQPEFEFLLKITIEAKTVSNVLKIVYTN